MTELSPVELAEIEACRQQTEANPVPLEVQAEEEDLDRLADHIVELSARIQVATYRLLELIREFDEREGWGSGFRSCAHWLNWRTGLSLGAAREKVRVANALGKLPLTSAAMRGGEISYSKVRALTRIATPENEEELLVYAKDGSAAHLERLVRLWRGVDRIAEAERDGRRRESRSLVAYTDEDGMVVVRGRLEPETGAVFLRALEAAVDRLYETSGQEQGDADDPPPIEHTRADALGLIAESALAADLDSGTKGDRYMVTLHVDAPVLESREGDEGHPGMAIFEDGVSVSAETSRRIACDCATVAMAHDSEGNVLDVGRKTRTISPAMRRALEYRDTTCRFPGCAVKVCEGHHVRHWADGGETSLDNLVLLCRRHHVAVHEEGYRVELEPDGRARFYSPQGWEIEQAPALSYPVGDADPELVDFVAEKGVPIGAWTGSAECYADGGRVDYGLVIGELWQPPPGLEPLPPWLDPDCEPPRPEGAAPCPEPAAVSETSPRERESRPAEA